MLGRWVVGLEGGWNSLRIASNFRLGIRDYDFSDSVPTVII